MALELDFDICQTNNCSTITITDVSGAYDANNNLTGWGSPNIAYNDAGIEITISITDSEDTTTDYTVTGEVTGNDGDTQFTPIDIDIPDGEYSITYTVSTNTASASVTKKFFSYCTVKCCVFTKIKDAIAKANCNCEKDITYELFIWGIYKSMIFAASGCNYSEAQNYLEELQLICDSDECNCN